MHHVKDTGKDLTHSELRFYQTNLPLSFHNDGADVFMLMCYRSADRGGLSKIVSAVSVFNTILERRPELAEVLQKPFFSIPGDSSFLTPLHFKKFLCSSTIETTFMCCISVNT